MIEIGRFGITIEDFENGFGKEITSNGPILDSWWQVHVHTNRKIRFTFRISNLLSAKTDNIEPNFDVIILSWYKTHKLSTYGSLFWSRKVFEGVHSHVMGSLHSSIVRISDFGPGSYFESKLEQNRNFELLKVDQNRF